MITQQLARELFSYEDGRLFRKGKEVGWLNNTGYLRVQVNNKAYLVHQIVFLIHRGYIPTMIDHLDGNKLNNKIENLRECTPSQNQCNAKLRKDSITGVKNVSKHKKDGKFHVRFYVEGKRKTIAIVDDLELAELVAEEARILLHKEFARTY